ncbi:SDR family oxidoreductase [Hugenholtzia roseola]|uniref:SDR family oxidoreductase n=1 Tax=Hugenholtzia roseola TaxID=1002 RepID=UPI00040564DD|nr:SDR family oxidoreductase [Hugenholtzia roseola]
MNTTLQNSVVLVTGGAGFIGSNLCEKFLSQNNQVICLDNFLTGKRENIADFLTHPNFKLIEGDIRQLETCLAATEGVEVVLHQAALGSVPRSIENPILTNDINISGMLNMLWAAKENKVRRFVYAASSSTYGDSEKLPKVEENIGKPLSPYAITKYVNELYAQNFAALYGLEVVGLRYFNVFGRRQDPAGAYAAVIPKFIMLLMQKKQPTINGKGDYSRDFTYIDNVLQINELAAQTQNPQALNTVYNVACGGRTSLLEMYQILRHYLAQYDSQIATLDPIFAPYRKGDIPHSQASIEKAVQYLGYRPTHNFEAGVRAAIDWYWHHL